MDVHKESKDDLRTSALGPTAYIRAPIDTTTLKERSSPQYVNHKFCIFLSPIDLLAVSLSGLAGVSNSLVILHVDSSPTERTAGSTMSDLSSHSKVYDKMFPCATQILVLRHPKADLASVAAQACHMFFPQKAFIH